MADVTLACATRSIVLSEDPPYVARCDTLARTPFAAAGSAGVHVHQLALAFRGHVLALDRVR